MGRKQATSWSGVTTAAFVLLGCANSVSVGSPSATPADERIASPNEERVASPNEEQRTDDLDELFVLPSCTQGLEELNPDTGPGDCYSDLPTCIEWCELGDTSSCLPLAANSYGQEHPALVQRLCAEGYLHACVVLARDVWQNSAATDTACAGARLDYACRLGNNLACMTRAFYVRDAEGAFVRGVDETYLHFACGVHSDPVACGAWAAFYETGELGLTASPARAVEIRAGYCSRRPQDCANAPSALSGLSAHVIRVVVRYHLPEIEACYEPHAGTHRGVVRVRWIVDVDGSVREAIVVDGLHAPIDECVTARVREWRFPPPSGGGLVSVTYPFTLTNTD
jgi:hypothetical protein